MNEAEVAKLTMNFMNRCQVQGSEVMHFVGCMQWLESKVLAAEPQREPDEPPAPLGG